MPPCRRRSRRRGISASSSRKCSSSRSSRCAGRQVSRRSTSVPSPTSSRSSSCPSMSGARGRACLGGSARFGRWRRCGAPCWSSSGAGKPSVLFEEAFAMRLVRLFQRPVEEHPFILATKSRRASPAASDISRDHRRAVRAGVGGPGESLTATVKAHQYRERRPGVRGRDVRGRPRAHRHPAPGRRFPRHRPGLRPLRAGRRRATG